MDFKPLKEGNNKLRNHLLTKFILIVHTMLSDIEVNKPSNYKKDLKILLQKGLPNK